MIGNSTKFNKINSRKHRKSPIHLTTYRGWEYSWLRRWIKMIICRESSHFFSSYGIMVSRRLPCSAVKGGSL